jgi:hypothetical protein
MEESVNATFLGLNIYNNLKWGKPFQSVDSEAKWSMSCS